ncbi:putative transcription factor MYB-HB-like family [Helianthus annuus]|uniref:MYB transcription factor n=2 Tax=Helianthus annuus TaxID=4232 RepID=A0A251ULX1_HELAN|nr:putative transcription factor MYB-related family [Helianthus annuus]KAJ0550365.1 putative transcription factor MYB-HB-like family [Helianthus annuus]KAJ0557070.1 putative transcription factor MYB-HB-like family [Helianthus annuus]KAJ0563322.1 putative transcription factor MYB-HB-like family [Helianthus annuus]KAJ0731420.1 putative transcription factor MYB-HB-like family [Helianthus annuus]
MGVPKQRWTSEEEAALKAGVVKHGPGKWSTILKDPEFESVLRLRSNVDLKDKWRNMHSMPGGCGSRQRARPTRSKAQPVFTAFKDENDMQICLPDSSTELAETLQYGSSKRPMPRLDTLILKAIANQKESRGSSRAAIIEYIEEKHSALPNLEKSLKAELKTLTDSGKLVKVKHRYKIAQTLNSDVKKNPSLLVQEVKNECGPMSAPKILTKAEIDAELEKMRGMTPQQAAAMAVKAVAEAEAAIAAAERAAKEAETAEADANLAKVFAAAAAMRAVKQTTLCTCDDEMGFLTRCVVDSC